MIHLKRIYNFCQLKLGKIQITDLEKYTPKTCFKFFIDLSYLKTFLN